MLRSVTNDNYSSEVLFTPLLSSYAHLQME